MAFVQQSAPACRALRELRFHLILSAACQDADPAILPLADPRCYALDCSNRRSTPNREKCPDALPAIRNSHHEQPVHEATGGRIAVRRIRRVRSVKNSCRRFRAGSLLVLVANCKDTEISTARGPDQWVTNGDIPQKIAGNLGKIAKESRCVAGWAILGTGWLIDRLHSLPCAVILENQECPASSRSHGPCG